MVRKKGVVWGYNSVSSDALEGIIFLPQTKELDMFKVPLVIASVFALSGCASSMQYSSDFQKTSSSDEHGEVYANLTRYIEPGFFQTTVKNEIEIFIDDELVTRAPLYQDYSGELYFFYHGMPVEVDCVQRNVFTTPECAIQINGKRSGKLAFKLR